PQTEISDSRCCQHRKPAPRCNKLADAALLKAAPYRACASLLKAAPYRACASRTESDFKHQNRGKRNRTLFRERGEEVSDCREPGLVLPKCEPCREEQSRRQQFTSAHDAYDGFRLRRMRKINDGGG